uniref:Uncharacterized protein MANES_14G044400 n=1 Tax=Rhizophora mucronata TaxID=61149 RepID=A0A2P2J9I2_RHIMU
MDERIFCDNCRTSIFDFHRSCSNCSSDLCLTCCREICNGNLQGGGQDVAMDYINHGLDYVHGGEPKIADAHIVSIEDGCEDPGMAKSGWKANENGSILCSCGNGLLELKCLYPTLVSELVKKAEEIAKRCKHVMTNAPVKQCACFDPNGHVDMSNGCFLKAASREDSADNYLYCPRAKNIKEEDLKHFQYHWMRAEPVIVSNALETGTGLSWEPMVMWRAVRQIKNENYDTLLDVKAIDCLDLCEV